MTTNIVSHRSIVALAITFGALAISGCSGAPDASAPIVPPSSEGDTDGGTSANPTPAPPVPGDPATPASGPGTYQGTANGFAINIVDGMAMVEVKALTKPESPAKAFSNILKISLTDTSGTCADQSANLERKNSHEVFIKITHYGATAAEAALAAGTYQLSGPTEADTSRIRLYTRDATCALAGSSSVIDLEGTTVREVVITSITATHVQGTYQIKKGATPLVSGTFDTDVCTAPENDVPAACQ